jgi:hypothetical protein
MATLPKVMALAGGPTLTLWRADRAASGASCQQIDSHAYGRPDVEAEVGAHSNSGILARTWTLEMTAFSLQELSRQELMCVSIISKLTENGPLPISPFLANSSGEEKFFVDAEPSN